MGRLIIIVAADDNRGIGKGNALPWHLAADLRRFKEYTSGQVVVMGRKTFDSIGHPLKGRTNIVVTKDSHFYHPEVPLLCRDPHDIPNLLKVYDRDIFVIGGQSVYEAVWDKADLIYYTRIHASEECDRFVPEIPKEYNCVYKREIPADENNDYPTTFEIWKRKKQKRFPSFVNM